MLEEIKLIKTENKDLRSFGITFGIIFLIIAGFLLYMENKSFQLFIVISSIFIIFSFLIPIILKPIYIAWMSFAIILGWFMTRLILSLLFYLIVTPIGLLTRVLGKDFLELKKEASNNSYWNQRDSSFEKNQSYEKQF
tara:strand:- start:117 stop:530 length:414 start_codon:yes stop_codon:yes gene_type:complete